MPLVLVVDNTRPRGDARPAAPAKMLPKLLRHLQRSEVRYVVARSARDVATAPACDAVILSGGPGHVPQDTLEGAAASVAALLRGVPTLGICYGFHCMAAALGGTVVQLPRRCVGWVGVERVATVPSAVLGGAHKAYANHRDAVSAVPQGFAVTARYSTSGRTVVAAAEDAARSLYGVQFHPEASGDWGERVIGRFVDAFVLAVAGPPQEKSRHPQSKMSSTDSSNTSGVSASSYGEGGFYPGQPSEVLESGEQQFSLVKMIGYGGFSTVWLAEQKVVSAAGDEEQGTGDEAQGTGDEAPPAGEGALAEGALVALKICKGDPAVSAAARHEAEIMAQLAHPSLLRLLGTHSIAPKHGASPHQVLVLPHMKADLFGVLRLHTDGSGKPTGMAVPLAVAVSRQLFQGLAHMASLGFAHTDLKPENILFENKCVADTDPRAVQLKIADFGSVMRPGDPFRLYGHTAAYRSPECLFRRNVGPPTDVWSAATLVFEMLTNDQLFRNMPVDGSRGSSTTADTAAGIEKDIKRDFALLYAMVEVLGKFPRAVARANREFFTRDGNFRRPVDIRTRPLGVILREDYGLDEAVARAADRALQPMLRYNPTRRLDAAGCLQLKFFGGPGRRSETRSKRKKKPRKPR